MRNQRHDISPLSPRARALLLLTIEKIKQTGLYNQNCTKFTYVEHICALVDSPLCIVGWMNALASSLGLEDNGLTREQHQKLYWYRHWPKKFKVVGEWPNDEQARDIKPEVGIARIKCFLKSGGTR